MFNVEPLTDPTADNSPVAMGNAFQGEGPGERRDAFQRETSIACLLRGLPRKGAVGAKFVAL